MNLSCIIIVSYNENHAIKTTYDNWMEYNDKRLLTILKMIRDYLPFFKNF